MDSTHNEPALIDCSHCKGVHYLGERCPLTPDVNVSFGIALPVCCPLHNVAMVRSPFIDTASECAFYCRPYDHHVFIMKFQPEG